MAILATAAPVKVTCIVYMCASRTEDVFEPRSGLRCACLRAQGYTYRRDPLVTPWAWGARSRSFSPPGTWVAFFQLFSPFYIWMLQRSSKREKHDTLTTDLHVGEVIHLQHFRGTSAAHA